MSTKSLNETNAAKDSSESLKIEKEVTVSDFITETRPWYKVPHLRLMAFYTFIITLSATTNGFDGSLLNGLQSTKYWSPAMGHPTGHVLGALSNGTIFGGILCFPFAPWLMDRYGRKWILFAGEVLVVIGSILQGASTDYAFFLITRMIIGFGGGLAGLASPALISEVSYPTHREIATFSYNICWYLGAIVAAVVTFLTRHMENNYSWKIPSYLQAFFPFVQLFFIYWIPESPRYLVSRAKTEQARDILIKHHIGGSMDPADMKLVDFEMNEIEAAIELEKFATANSNYSDFWTRKTFRKRLFLCCFVAIMQQLSGNGLVSYYLNKVLNSIGITGDTEQLRINMWLMFYNFIICAIVCFTSNRFTRRQLFVTSTSSMLLTFIVWTVLSAFNQKRNFDDKSLGSGVLAMIFLFYFAYNIGLNGLPFLYITEILPYSHRTKGLTIYTFVMYIVLVFNGFVNPIAMDAIEWKYYIVYVCVLAVEVVVVFLFFPETSGRTLEEVAEVFGDGKQSREAVELAIQEKRNSFEHVENA